MVVKASGHCGLYFLSDTGLPQPRRHRQIWRYGMKVSDILRVKGNTLYTVSPDESLASAVQVMSERDIDRKSTRLNSSHLVISYAVFCLKKKKKKNIII